MCYTTGRFNVFVKYQLYTHSDKNVANMILYHENIYRTKL